MSERLTPTTELLSKAFALGTALYGLYRVADSYFSPEAIGQREHARKIARSPQTGNLHASLGAPVIPDRPDTLMSGGMDETTLLAAAKQSSEIV